MTKRGYWDESESEKRKRYQENIERKLDLLLVEYEMEYEETPFYQNTSNCQLEGAIDELKSINPKQIDCGGSGCYLGGRIEALERLKKMVIFGDKND